MTAATGSTGGIEGVRAASRSQPFGTVGKLGHGIVCVAKSRHRRRTHRVVKFARIGLFRLCRRDEFSSMVIESRTEHYPRQEACRVRACYDLRRRRRAAKRQAAEASKVVGSGTDVKDDPTVSMIGIVSGIRSIPSLSANTVWLGSVDRLSV